MWTKVEEAIFELGDLLSENGEVSLLNSV